MATTLEDQQQRLTRAGLAAVRKLRDLKAQKDEIDLKIKAAEALLKKEHAPDLGGKIICVDGRGNPLVTVSTSVVRSLSATMVRKRDPELAEECTVESSRTKVTLAPVES